MRIRGDLCAPQNRFPTQKGYIRTGQIYVALTARFCLLAGQNHPCLNLVQDLVVVACTAVFSHYFHQAELCPKRVVEARIIGLC